MAGFKNIAEEGVSTDASCQATRNSAVHSNATRNNAARSGVIRSDAARNSATHSNSGASHPVRRIYHIITTLIMVVAIVLAAALVGVRLIGLDVYTVLSGSMEPTYHTGSVIYVKSVDPLQLAEGDVITFMLDEDTIATHRIVQVVPDEEDSAVVRFQTQGDANSAPDGSLVHCNNVIGTPVFTIPYLGYLADYVQNPPGMYVAIAACAVLILLTFLPDLFAKDEEEEEKRGKTSQRPQTSPQQRRQQASQQQSAQYGAQYRASQNASASYGSNAYDPNAAVRSGRHARVASSAGAHALGGAQAGAHAAREGRSP